MMEYAYVNLDGKNKLIVQVHNHEKANQTFNTIIILYYFNFSFAPDFYCLDDSHCNEKGSCNIDFGHCVCVEDWNGFLDCTFCKFQINVHFIKLFFSFTIFWPASTRFVYFLHWHLIKYYVPFFFALSSSRNTSKFIATFVEVAIELCIKWTFFPKSIPPFFFLLIFY